MKNDDKVRIFLSHASEDKESIADDLAVALKEHYDVWYDRFELTLGDSLLAKISEGLNNADFGVVILSQNFFGKKWTQAELDGLFALEEPNKKVILPIWHNVTVEEVKSFSLILAGKLGIETGVGINKLVSAIRAAVDATNRALEFNATRSIKSRVLSIDSKLAEERRSEEMLASKAGLQLVRNAVEKSSEEVMQTMQSIANDSEILRIRVVDGKNEPTERVVGVRLPYNLAFSLHYFLSFVNTAKDGALGVSLSRVSRDIWDEQQGREPIVVHRFYPYIGSDDNVIWKDENIEIGEDQMATFLCELMIATFEKDHELSMRKSKE